MQPTPYADVNTVLLPLLAEVPAILGPDVVGAYLFGSLASGNFDRESDVDVLVVTNDDLSADQFAALQAMHLRLAALPSWCATQLEVSYIPRAALRRYDPTHNVHPHIDRGRGESLHLVEHDRAWVVQRWVLRQCGITLLGPAPATLIDPVSAGDLRQAMREMLNGWAAGFLDHPERIHSRGYQSYIVLTLCRILYTFQHGTVVSKREAVQWAQQTLGEPWASLIARAWVGRQHADDAPEGGEVEATLKFIKHAIERSERHGK